MTGARDKSRSLTVLLLKDGGTEPGDFIRPEKLTAGLRRFPLEIAPNVRADLFVRTTTPRPPRWATFFSDHIMASELGQVSSSAAALVMEVKETWFALTFGYGLYLLRSEQIVEGFGLRTTLNAVDEEALRSVDKETFDALANQSRLQSSQGAAAGEFGIDVEKDLLKAVTGQPRDDTLAQRLSGKDALAITTLIALENVPDLLMRLLEVFRAELYKKAFRWVDDVKRITDEQVTEELDAELFSQIASGDYTNSWLAPPDILEWADVRFFSYSDGQRARVYTDIHWRTLLRNLKAPLSKDTLKRKKVFCYGEDDNPIRRWPVYSCVYANLDFDGGTYLLTGGNWYRVASDFVGEIDDWFGSFPKDRNRLPVYKHESEGRYNADVAASSAGHYALMDQKFIRYGRAQDIVEFCDLLGQDGEMDLGAA